MKQQHLHESKIMTAKKPVLGTYKTNKNNAMPVKATKGSACFDLSYNPHGKTNFRTFNINNVEVWRDIHRPSGKAFLMPGERVLLPTGIIFDIPSGYSLRIYSRSSLALTKGLVLANSVGIIDEDYTNETFVMIHNASNVRVEISPGDRIAQAELIKVYSEYTMKELNEAPEKKDSRSG